MNKGIAICHVCLACKNQEQQLGAFYGAWGMQVTYNISIGGGQSFRQCAFGRKRANRVTDKATVIRQVSPPPPPECIKIIVLWLLISLLNAVFHVNRF